MRYAACLLACVAAACVHGPASAKYGISILHGGSPGLFDGVISKPSIAGVNFTTMNTVSGATYTDTAQGIEVYAPNQGSTNHLALLGVAAPAAPYSLYVLVGTTPNGTGDCGLMMGWANGLTSTSKLDIALIEPNQSSGANAFRHMNFSDLNSAPTAQTVISQQTRVLMWYRLKDDGTSVSFADSATGDANTFQDLDTVLKSTGNLGTGGYTDLVIGVQPYSCDGEASILSWKVTLP